MRAANGNDSSARGGGYGGGRMGYEPPQEYDDRIQCDYCGRKFNEQAGKRHIPHCAEKAKKNVIRGGPAPARRR